ncbi:MAG: hypothetical protein WCE94_00245 [Candidatus Methanoperedens sp.]
MDSLTISTIFLVVATGIIAYYNRKLWIAQDKPWLHFYVRQNAESLYVKNIGKGAALKVRCNIRLGGSGGDGYEPDALEPGQESVIREFPIRDNNGNPLEIEIEDIVYEDINEITYKQKPIRPQIVDFNDNQI